MLVVTVILSVLFEKPLPLEKTGLSHESVYASWNPKLRDGDCTYFLPLECVRLRNEDQKFKDCLGVHRESSYKKTTNQSVTKQE